ncbi:MAG: AAA family ATPase, partial [Albidovulum sp.]|nr:AAA family ATPase [Albidovulum sp.]
MRLRRLNMLRYGMFDGYSLDFGPSTSGNSDFHIVFGPNEAGKTTIFNGLLDCFFGIPNRTQYSFRHGSAMSVGAALEIDG